MKGRACELTFSSRYSYVILPRLTVLLVSSDPLDTLAKCPIGGQNVYFKFSYLFVEKAVGHMQLRR